MFKTARAIAQKYGRVAIEDLQVWNMTKSTRGTIEERGGLRLLHDSIKYPPIDNRNDPPRLSKEVLSHAKKKEDHGLRCVQQWRIKNHDQTRRKSEDPAPDTR